MFFGLFCKKKQIPLKDMEKTDREVADTLFCLSMTLPDMEEDFVMWQQVEQEYKKDPSLFEDLTLHDKKGVYALIEKKKVYVPDVSYDYPKTFKQEMMNMTRDEICESFAYNYLDYMNIRDCGISLLLESKRFVRRKENIDQVTTNPSFEFLSNKWHVSQPIIDDLNAIQKLVLRGWSLGPTHSNSHWNRVFDNGMKLCVDGVDPIVIQYFAYLHDSCRNDDWEDWQHGERAAEWLPSIRTTYLKNLSEEQFNKLQTACRLHTTTHRTGDPTVDACFDADRLDLWRCNIKPDPKKMATKKGTELAGLITYEKMNELLKSYYLTID